MMMTAPVTLALTLMLVLALCLAEPNTCQPRAEHPFMPIYHIIGNVTTDANEKVTRVEAINDVSSAFLYKGIFHVFHQCCQNHWDHVVSKDFVHWTRLPPPIVPNFNPTAIPHPDWYDAHGSWDGSLSIPRDDSSFPGGNGIEAPVVMMTAVPGKAPPNLTNASSRLDHITMAIVRASKPEDPFLLSWTKDAANPITYSNGTKGTISTPYDTPGQIWKTGDHWNYLVMGLRYTTTDPTFLSWGLAPGKSTFASRENGGQWFSKLANQRDGLPPPAGSPGWMMNVGGGNRFALGEYFPANETWVTDVQSATIDSGPNSNWEYAGFVGAVKADKDKRFMNIGWETGGPPMMSAVNHVSQQPPSPWSHDGQGGPDVYPYEINHAFTQRPQAALPGNCAVTSSWEVFTGFTNIYDRMPAPTNVTHGTIHFIGIYASVDACFAAVNASTEGPFHSFTWNDGTIKAPYGNHCWADTSFTWQNRGGAKGQVAGRGPGFPIAPKLPSGFTHDHLTGLREVAYDPLIKTLISNPVSELLNLRNGTLGGGKAVKVTPGAVHMVEGTGAPADASTADVVINITVPDAAESAAIGVNVLANASAGKPFGGILTVVNFTKPAADGSMKATASIRTLNPCGGGSSGLATTTFPILKGETTLDIRLLIDRSIVEVFVMGGRVVFSKVYAPALLMVPDTHVAVQAWGAPVTADVEVYSMGCGWTAEPYQTNPTMESIGIAKGLAE